MEDVGISEPGTCLVLFVSVALKGTGLFDHLERTKVASETHTIDISYPNGSDLLRP